jgi:hypothetical protein
MADSWDFWFSIGSIILGLAVFLWLALGTVWNKKSKLGDLDNGEIRKAIMVAFTVIYIIMLPYYFFNAYMPAAINISKTNASELVILPSGQLHTINVTANSVPSASVNDLLRNFLWVYIVLIVFYFGSRTIDGYTEAKRIEQLKGSDAAEVVRTQYARGKIDVGTMNDKLKALNEPEKPPTQEGGISQPAQ